MFCSSPAPRLNRRLLGALRLARSFLLLEDDYKVDWEVDQDEPAVPMRRGLGSDRDEPAEDGHDSMGEGHPHRMALQSRLSVRRPGIVVPHEQVCLCPVGGRARAGVSRGSFLPERSCAALPRGAGSSRNP
ncbi:MAG: hypothetical protein WBV85_06625 [Solirubrobacteraceae bacterium]